MKHSVHLSNIKNYIPISQKTVFPDKSLLNEISAAYHEEQRTHKYSLRTTCIFMFMQLVLLYKGLVNSLAQRICEGFNIRIQAQTNIIGEFLRHGNELPGSM